MHINDEMTHTHSHEHTHADGTTHTHEHIHDHTEAGHTHGAGEGHTHTHDGSTHTHTHDHDHGHTHDHDHVHGAAPEGVTDLEKTKALLAYMLHHNEHHAEELAGLLDALPEPAKSRLSLAIGTFEAANVELKEALDCLE